MVWVKPGGRTEASTLIHTSDLSTSQKLASSTLIESNDVITFTVLIRNTGDVSSNAMMTDTLPAGLTLVGLPVVVSGPGSVNAVGNIITWQGTLLSGYTDTQAEVRYSAQVGTLEDICQTFTNTANIVDNQGNEANPFVILSSACWHLYLPFIARAP